MAETKKKRTRRKSAKAETKSAVLKIERKKLSDLKPHPKNPRKHPNEDTPEWNALKASLQHDYFDPLVWNKRNGCLVSGHLRTKVLNAEDYTEADVVVVDYDENTHIARMIAANNPAGTDKDSELAKLVGQLRTDGFDLALTTLTSDELSIVGDFNKEKAYDNKAGEAKEIDVEEFEFEHNCPRCHFGFNEKD